MSIPFEQDNTGDDRETRERALGIIAINVIRQIRKALGLSQQEMADLVGVSRQMMNYYEQGKAYPSALTWMNWLRVIEKQIRELRKEQKRKQREGDHEAGTASLETPQREGEGLSE